MEFIADFEKLYYRPSLQPKKGKDIVISAHKDRVWFFIIQWENGSFRISSYGTIDAKYAESLKCLYVERLNRTIEVSCQHINWPYYSLHTHEALEHWDFLSFKPWFSIEWGEIWWPYLDNIIGIWVAEKVSTQYSNVGTFQTIDEEASLQYSTQKDAYKVSIIIDTIQQDYVKEPLDFDSIYSVTDTSFSQLSVYKSAFCKPLELKVGFVLESDIIKAEKKYFLLCPIQGGHVEKSGVKIDTVTKLLSAVKDIIEHESL